MTGIYDDSGWSPITLKTNTKKRLNDIKKDNESWTEVVERVLDLAEKAKKGNK